MPETSDSTAVAPKPTSRAIAVGLNEAALDSPTFRVTATHFSEQTEAVERWLNGYVSSTSKLTHDILALEETINNYLSKTMPSAADGVVDNDYTFLALKRVGDGSREYWMQLLSTMKKMDNAVVDPIRTFMTGELRMFKECRRALEQAQRTFDSTLARYVSQSKTKEPSSLREDAFAVYETRKAYLKASMDFCQLAPQLRFSMDKLLVKICSNIWQEMRRCRDAVTNATRWGQEMDRVRGWSKEMEASETIFKTELGLTRRNLADSTLAGFKPSRELEDYSTSTVPFLGSRGPVHVRPKDGGAMISEKQGWLFLRMVTGKPARHSWVRRWYYCRDGIFGWLIPGPLGVLQGDEIGVLLCNAKPAVGEERRFCFEVKTKSQTILLQSETQHELTEWLEVFEVTKKQAFEATMSRGSSAIAGGIDPAFSITPPSIPEFSAKSLDAQIGLYEESGSGYERTSTLPVPGQDGNLATRQSFDVNGSLSRRSITALGRDLAREVAREEGESNREHAARIIQRLDLHRKATFGGPANEIAQASAGGSSSGLASLISSSHTLLPGYPNPLAAPTSSRQTPNMLPTVDTSPGTLAPLTLTKPPAMTGLSRTAVLTAGERVPLGLNRKMPTSVMANYWGSNVWGAVNAPVPPVLPRIDEDDPIGVVVPGNTQSVMGKGVPQSSTGEVFPINYPPELRAQHAQFRLLFPSVPLEEKLVLVFRAAWTSSPVKGSSKASMMGDGRVYVTPDSMYFYGVQIGLVTAYSISLDVITEVTAAPGRDCDFIFLQLGKDSNDTGCTKITIKVFLEELGLLHTRLNLLIDDLQAEEPMGVESIISALINLEKEEYDRPSPSVESWEEVSPSTPMDDGTHSGRPVVRRHNDFSPHLRPSKSRAKPNNKLHLPARPVIYEPEGMKEMAAERNFEISAKACFHVLFGDKSFVFPKLYFERRAEQIAQGPWVLVDQGRMRRDFQFKVDYKDILGRSKTANVNDYQTIDVFHDHVTYVVTHVKTAWHLPHSTWFKLITKIVITHVGKSKCKLAVYIQIDWSKLPALSKNLVERQALHDAATDADDLAEVATDQVRKLGPRSRTNRAIQVYGQVGQQTQVVLFSPAATESAKKQAIKPRTLTAMLFETLRSFGESALSSLIMWAFAVLRNLFNLISAQRLLLALLAFSILTNVLLTSGETSTWWQERKAAGFMQSIGIRPNSIMSKAIYMADLTEASGADQELSFPQNSTCFDSFKELLDATDINTPWEDAGSTLATPVTRSAARRLRRTRQRLGTYRHDLLVAMRVVNSVERELLQSEWENWLVNEKAMCDDLNIILREDDKAKSGKGSQKSTALMPDEKRKSLEEFRENHCGSCKSDHQVVMQQRKLGTM
ncbi:Fc.00g112180.m01.CDS01 [Cosmosporella sp. VM-42]